MKTIQELPDDLHSIVGAARIEPIERQGKVAKTCRLVSSGGIWVLKRATSEMSRLRLEKEACFLRRFSPPESAPYRTPALVAADSCHEWLLLSWVHGQSFRGLLRSATDPDKLGHLIDEYARCLKWLHRLPLPEDAVPGEWLAAKLEEVDRNIANGWVDADDWEPENIGKSIEQLREQLRQTVPRHSATRLIHGDAASDNFLLIEGKIVGVIDWSEAGAGDPHADLALAWREMARLPQPQLTWRRFLVSYGRDVDMDRIRFYLLLDEFM